MNYKKERLDVLLVQQNLVESREKARRLIMAGQVFVDDHRVDKAGARVPREAQISVKGDLCPYVSRGGLKLAKAMDEFSLDVSNKVALDIGASTGGFTDCLLQHGARKVYAIDVGYGQLAWKLRSDPRVVVWERTNIRYVRPEQLDELGQVATIDVAFISLTKILSVVADLLVLGADLVTLIKPQFEAGPDQVGKNGIVRDRKVHTQVLYQVIEAARMAGFKLRGLTFSPITGADGNIEFLGYFVKAIANAEGEKVHGLEELIHKVVKDAWDNVWVGRRKQGTLQV